MRFACRWWVPLSTVFIAAIGVCLTVHFWDWLTQQESPSATIRNAGLVIATPVALILAVWRSSIAQEQADTAERNLINEQFKSGVELLGHESATVRLGGITTLNEMAELHPKLSYTRVMNLFETFLTYPPVFKSLQGSHLKGAIDYGSRDIAKIIQIINARTPEQRAGYQFHFASTAPFIITGKDDLEPNPDHPDFIDWMKAGIYETSMLAKERRQRERQSAGPAGGGPPGHERRSQHQREKETER